MPKCFTTLEVERYNLGTLMKKITINTNFSEKNPPTDFKKVKDELWDDGGIGSIPNGYFMDYDLMPEKISLIEISGKNFISSDEEFLDKNRIFLTSQNNKHESYEIKIYDDYYFKLKEKNKHYADMYVAYDDLNFEDGYQIRFDIMLDSATFKNIYNKISDIKDKFNFEITLNIDEMNIFPESKKEGVESARYDVVDFQLR